MTENGNKVAERKARGHYFLREDFEELMGVIPNIDVPTGGDALASCSLVYPKHTAGAVAELKLRGLTCDGELLVKLVEEGIVSPKLMAGSKGIHLWDRGDIDAAAEWLYENEHWDSWTHFCWVSNLRFGQAVKAHRVACVKYGLGFALSFDVPGLVTVIEPSPECADYARIRFFPMGTKLGPQEASE
ncbi:MAG: hypothetical protein JXL80_12960 [Planctomycetes bacterium]|nr:hypothetical protein [Planctomycetota bacterium]